MQDQAKAGRRHRRQGSRARAPRRGVQADRHRPRLRDGDHPWSFSYNDKDAEKKKLQQEELDINRSKIDLNSTNAILSDIRTAVQMGLVVSAETPTRRRPGCWAWYSHPRDGTQVDLTRSAARLQ